MTPQQFATKWKASTLKESSASQEHFIDLCHILDEPTPAEADPDGSWFCFERGAKKTGGGDGWADVWRRGCFAWEYKGKHKDLTAAFVQLQRYAIALENPPLLVVSDMDTILIHTNFTNTVHEVHAIPIDELANGDNLRKLKWLFTEPDRLRPGTTTTAITEEAASKFAALADVLRQRGVEAQRVAHFLNRVLFCMFAEDAGLLPSRLVIRLLEAGVKHPAQANNMLKALFAAMMKGGLFGADLIEWFNGGLFDTDDTVPLEPDDIKELLAVSRLDWSSIEPSVFGTLFERGLDPSKRAQLGAHYTDPQSIMRLVQPVVIEPLEAEWQTAKKGIEAALAKVTALPVIKGKKQAAKPKAYQDAEALYTAFLHRLAEFRVLDPACGSGNFLYLALQALKDLELRVTLEAEQMGLHAGFVGMNVGVQCVRGIELNTYAAELARVTVWIGEIQWMLHHGVPPSKNPILKPLETIECRDAVINENHAEPTWPPADAIVGNPPFLGDKKMKGELGADYVVQLRRAFNDRLPGGTDLVTYWFEKARTQIESGKTKYAGLVATNSIRGGANRKVLERIAATTKIFDAWSDEPWVNEGAAVRVSLVCFGDRPSARLNGQTVSAIHPDLTAQGAGAASAGADLTQARALAENAGTAFNGIQKTGDFDIPGGTARTWLTAAGNPNGKPNSDVLAPYWNGLDLVRRPRDYWIIDFGWTMPEKDAALYELPFKHVHQHVLPERATNALEALRRDWWRLWRPRPEMRKQIAARKRYIVTAEVSKHRVFGWLQLPTLPDKNLVVIARDDDATFGVLQSRMHELWALRLGTSLEDRPRYTPSSTFETFPFPEGLAPADTAAGWPKTAPAKAVAQAAKQLEELRQNWLNPPEWVEAVPEPVPGYPARIVAKPGREPLLQKRTLTNLYNERPSWLSQAHRDLDAAVAAAYGWTDYDPAMPEDEILRRLLALNLARASATGSASMLTPATP